MNHDTVYCYYFKSIKTSTAKIIYTNKILASECKQYDYSLDSYTIFTVHPLFKIKDCPHNMNVIESKEDVIKYANLILKIIQMAKGILFNPVLDIDNLNAEYKKLVSLYPIIFGIKADFDTIRTNTSIRKNYILTNNKNVILDTLKEVSKSKAIITYLDGCDELLSQCKKYLPIMYGMCYKEDKFCIFFTKHKDWEKKYDLKPNDYINNLYYNMDINKCTPQKLFVNYCVKPNSKNILIRRINGF